MYDIICKKGYVIKDTAPPFDNSYKDGKLPAKLRERDLILSTYIERLYHNMSSCLYALQHMLYNNQSGEGSKKDITVDAELKQQVNYMVNYYFDGGYDDYMQTVTTAYLDTYYRELYRIRDNNKETSEPKRLNTNALNPYLDFYNQLKGEMKDKILSALEKPGINPSDIRPEALYLQEKKKLDDMISQAGLDAKKQVYIAENIPYYTFQLQDGDSSCSRCRELDGSHIPVDEMEAGVNYPPLHPNCQCTVSVVETVETEEDSSSDGFHPFKKYIDAYFQIYSSVIIDGKEYDVDLLNLQGVILDPNGHPIKDGIATEIDLKLLRLMRLRDSTTNMSIREECLYEATKLMIENDGNFTVDFFRPYDYYTVTEDITDRLNEFMKESEKYASNWEGLWFIRLIEFKNLVQNSGPFDLKNQPEWQQAAFIYDGEIVSKDVLGNITYGYLGKVMGFPDQVLYFGAGIAQFQAETYETDSIFTYLDDPRDQVRAKQGIRYYYEQHPEKKAQEIYELIDTIIDP